MSNDNYNRITVVYLAWLPYGVEHLINFFKSYTTFNAGKEHYLLIALNGTSIVSLKEIEAFEQIIEKEKIVNAEVIKFSSGQDIFIYSKIAEVKQSTHFLFLNSFSNFKADNWLQHYTNAYSSNTGVVGATGSYASYPRMEARRFALLKKPADKIRLIKYLIKLKLLYNHTFPPFPNPHIRTTAFFIERNLFLDLKKRCPRNKMEAYYFENSIDSMTRQLLKKNLQCKIVDKYGDTYGIDEWKDSHTFWFANQENLLISDNRTSSYDEADDVMKKHMQINAWGK